MLNPWHSAWHMNGGGFNGTLLAADAFVTVIIIVTIVIVIPPMYFARSYSTVYIKYEFFAVRGTKK